MPTRASEVHRGADHDHRLGGRRLPAECVITTSATAAARREDFLTELRAAQGSDREEAHDVGCATFAHHHWAERTRDEDQTQRQRRWSRTCWTTVTARARPTWCLAPPTTSGRTSEWVARPSVLPAFAERSDRSAGDRLRHREKVCESIRRTTSRRHRRREFDHRKSRDKIIMSRSVCVRARSSTATTRRVLGQGEGQTQPGDVVVVRTAGGSARRQGRATSPGQTSTRPTSLPEELIEIMFSRISSCPTRAWRAMHIPAERMSK